MNQYSKNILARELISSSQGSNYLTLVRYFKESGGMIPHWESTDSVHFLFSTSLHFLVQHHIPQYHLCPRAYKTSVRAQNGAQCGKRHATNDKS